MYEFHEHIKIYYTYYNAMSGVVYESCFLIIILETSDNKDRFTQDANKSFQSVITEQCNKIVIKNSLLYDYTCRVLLVNFSHNT